MYKFFLKTDQPIVTTEGEVFPIAGASVLGVPAYKGFGEVVGILDAFNEVNFFVQADVDDSVTSQTILFTVREESCTGTKLGSKSATYETGSGLTPIQIVFDTPIYSDKELFFSVACTVDILVHGKEENGAIITVTTGSIVSNVCTSIIQEVIYHFAYQLVNTIEVTPNYDSALALQLSREPDKVFLRQKLNGNLFFQRDDYDFVRLATIESSYTLYVMSELDGIYSLYYRCEFSKTDCEFDDDNSVFSVAPTPLDQYELLLADIEKEFDLIDLNVPSTPVQNVKRPLFQVVTLGTGILSNHVDGNFWEEEISTSLFASDLINTYGFTAATELYGVSGYGDIDVSGEYTGSISLYTRLDNLYKVELNFNSYNDDGESIYEIIRISDGVVLYKTATLQIADAPDLTQRFFQGTGGVEGTFRFSRFTPYMRVLVDKESVIGYTVVEIPDVEDDILPYNYNYNWILKGVHMDSFLTTEHTIIPNAFPVGLGTPTDPSSDDKFYHVIPTPPPTTYPTAQSAWHGCAFWLSYGATAVNVIANGVQTIVNNYCYEISDVLIALLKVIDPTVTFQKTLGSSNFLHNDLANPVTGEAGFRLFISPKSNVISSTYDLPASKAPIKLADVFRLLKDGFNLRWYINIADGSLRIEHSSYFENGKDYTTPKVGLDLSLLNEIYTGVPWSTGFNKFTYEKINLPERIKTTWMDDVSEYFNGSNIEVISKYVTLGNEVTRTLNPFTSDIDYIQATPSKISKDGFALLAANFDLADSLYKVPIIDITINGNIFKLQNGNASLYYMHDKFMRHNLPANLVTINGTEVTATTTIRSKISTLESVIGADFDELELVKTDVGTGKIESAEILFETDGTGRRSLKLTVKYDTE